MALFAAKGVADGKETGGKISAAFRQMAVDRLRKCDNVVALSEELGVHRRLLYKWRQQLDPAEADGTAPPDTREFTLDQGDQSVEAPPGREDSGDRFFQRCLAKSRGSTPEQRKHWREGIYDQIREVMSMQGKLSVERMCALTAVSRAGFYRSFHQREPDMEEMELRSAIQTIVIEHKLRYGYRRVTAELRHRGFMANHKRVVRLMRLDNLLALRRSAFVTTTDSDHELLVHLNLASRMQLNGINQLWVADITFVRLQQEFVYLAVILDAYSRKVVGWALDRSLAAQLALHALQNAISSRMPDARACTSLRSRNPIRFGRIRQGLGQAPNHCQHESPGKSLGQRQMRELHEDS